MACTCFQACLCVVCVRLPLILLLGLLAPRAVENFIGVSARSSSAFICPSVPLENGSVAAIHLPAAAAIAAAAAERSSFGSLRARLRNQVGHTCEPDGARLRARVRGLGARYPDRCVAHYERAKPFSPQSFTSTLGIM